MDFRTNTAIEKLLRVSGLHALPAEAPKDIPAGGICIDVQNGCSTVVIGGTRAFTVDSTDSAAVRLAADFLACELCKRSAPVDPVRDFLSGEGELPPGVRVGKDDYYVLAIFGATRHKSMCEYLTAMAGQDDFVGDMSENVTAFCKKVNEDNDYQSAGEFAIVLRENLAEEIECNIKIGVGGIAHGVSELPMYYSYANSALVSGAEFDPNSDIYSHKEYALVRALSELPESAKERYVKTALDRNFREVLSDPELMTAADAFIRHSLNISEASRSLYVHRNTLIYRLDKIEKMTGLNIRIFNDAMTFRTAYIVSKML